VRALAPAVYFIQGPTTEDGGPWVEKWVEKWDTSPISSTKRVKGMPDHAPIPPGRLPYRDEPTADGRQLTA